MTRPHSLHAVRPSERGLSLVEVVVVVLLVAIIGAVGVRSVGGTKAQAGSMTSRAVALQLSEAASQFQRDHGGRVPGEPAGAGARDWNIARRSFIDRSNGSAPYLKAGTIEALLDGSVTLETSRGANVGGGTPSTLGRVRYVADTNRNVFVVVAFAKRGGRLVPDCWTSPATAASVQSMLRAQGVTARC